MKRNPTLDVVKGICILIVIITHANWNADERLRYGFPFWIDMAVPLFMLISGYVNAVSFRKKGVVALSECYTFQSIVSKLIRYTIPFVIAYIIENILFTVLNRRQCPTAVELLREFLCGGVGPGSYYYPILLQMIFVFPIIYSLICHKKTQGLVLCGVVNFVYELLQWAYGVPEGTYRLLIFRYILLLGFGCYFALDTKFNKPSIVLLGVFGAGCIYMFCYRGICPFFIPYWQGTSFLPTLFAVSVFACVYSRKISVQFLELMGKASYHIFLTQMVYYMFVYLIYERIPERELQLVLNVSICLVFGLLFYCIEAPISNLFVSLVIKYRKMHVMDRLADR